MKHKEGEGGGGGRVQGIKVGNVGVSVGGLKVIKIVILQSLARDFDL